MHTESTEDYLKAIYTLQADTGRVSTTALARHLGVSPASVTGMLKRLAGLRLVAHQLYRGAVLTADGRARALQVVRRHRLAELYLSRVLGLPLDRVHDEAHRWEHVLSEEVARRMDEALDHPTVDPHGAPIPTLDGRIADRPRTPLTELSAGREAVIAEVSDHDPDLLRYICELGLLPGASVLMVARRPFDGPLTVRVAGREHVIGPEVARHIHLDRTAPEHRRS